MAKNRASSSTWLLGLALALTAGLLAYVALVTPVDAPGRDGASDTTARAARESGELAGAQMTSRTTNVRGDDATTSPKRKVRSEKPSRAEFPLIEPELALLRELRRLEFSDSAESVRLVESFEARFPEAGISPERAWYQARNLVDLGRFDDAQQVARKMLALHPDDSWSRDLARHLLSHPLGLAPRDH